MLIRLAFSGTADATVAFNAILHVIFDAILQRDLVDVVISALKMSRQCYTPLARVGRNVTRLRADSGRNCTEYDIYCFQKPDIFEQYVGKTGFV